MSQTLTYMRDHQGANMYCSCESNRAIEEFAGYCECCWLDLTPEQRAILRGEEPPAKEIVEHRTEIYRLNPPNHLFQAIKIFWTVAITAAVTWLVWRTR